MLHIIIDMCIVAHMNTTTNTANRSAKIHCYTASCWEIKVTRLFTNYRLVAEGGDPYSDVEMSSPAYATREQAEEAVLDLINRGATVNETGTIMIDERNA